MKTLAGLGLRMPGGLFMEDLSCLGRQVREGRLQSMSGRVQQLQGGLSTADVVGFYRVQALLH